MPRTISSQPTSRELAVLHTLWTKPNQSLREVHAAMKKQTRTAYPTMQRLLDIMTNKGYLRRDSKGYPARYAPTVSKEEAQKRLVAQVINEWFQGSTKELVAMASKAGRVKGAKDMAGWKAVKGVKRGKYYGR